MELMRNHLHGDASNGIHKTDADAGTTAIAQDAVASLRGACPLPSSHHAALSFHRTSRIFCLYPWSPDGTTVLPHAAVATSYRSNPREQHAAHTTL